MTNGFARNSHQTPYQDIYEDNHCNVTVVAGSQRHKGVHHWGRRQVKVDE